MRRPTAAPGEPWTLVWEGLEPTASLAEEKLKENRVEVHRRREAWPRVRLYVPDRDARAARGLLSDR